MFVKAAINEPPVELLLLKILHEWMVKGGDNSVSKHVNECENTQTIKVRNW